MEKLRIGYMTDKQTIDSDSLKDFQFMENRRRLRQDQVRKLKKMILDGRHFDSPIIVNEKEGKSRILDGQHRIQAITEIINEKENYQIEVMVIKYRNLTTDQEKDTFVRWNSGTRQSSEDFIMMHVDDIKIFKMMDSFDNKDFPIRVTIYTGPSGSVRLRQIVEPYMAGRKKIFFNPYGPAGFVEEAKLLGKEDYEWIKKFTREFIENVGEIKQENIFTRTTGIAAIMFLYMNGDLNPNIFWKRFKEKVKKSKSIKDMVLAGGFAAARSVKKMMEEKMGIKKVDEKWAGTGAQIIFTEEKINWLRKNWPRSTWDKNDLALEFDEKFNVKVSTGTLSYYMAKNGIKKDPEFSVMGAPTAFTPKVIEFMRKCADEGMNSREAQQETQKEFEHMFNTGTFRLYATRNKIKFRIGNEKPKFSKKIEKIINENKDLISEEIRDKIIEKTGELIRAVDINNYLGRTKHPRNNKQEDIHKDKDEGILPPEEEEFE